MSTFARVGRPACRAGDDCRARQIRERRIVRFQPSRTRARGYSAPAEVSTSQALSFSMEYQAAIFTHVDHLANTALSREAFARYLAYRYSLMKEGGEAGAI